MYELKFEDLSELMTVATNHDETASAYPRYSGRYMYGSECFGIVCSDPTGVMFALGRSVGEEELPEELSEPLAENRQDGMGLQRILYFPNLSVSRETAARWEQLTEPVTT